jgi:hypothetical protein
MDVNFARQDCKCGTAAEPAVVALRAAVTHADRRSDGAAAAGDDAGARAEPHDARR